MVKFLTSLIEQDKTILMEELTDKRGNPLKDSLTLQCLLQVYSHVLPVSQPSTIVVCLQVTWKEKKKNPGSFFAFLG